MQMRGGQAAGAPPQYYAPPADAYQELPPETPEMNLEPWLDTTYYQEALDGFNIYDPTLWLPTIRFSVKGMMFWPWFLISLSTFLLAYDLLSLHPEHVDLIMMPLTAHGVLGGALSFLVVMRTDTSMNRWWEARCSWQTILNNCVSIGCQTAPALPTAAQTEQMLMELMAFVLCLKAWLRDTTVQREEIGPRMDWNYIRRLNAAYCPPATALNRLSHTARQNLPEKLGAAIYDETSEALREMNDMVGACIKIKRTPMVFSYIATLRTFMLLWLSTLCIPLIGDFGWLAVPVSSLIAFLFLSVEQMAVEIEGPFGNDANDLPIESFLIDLEKILLEMTPGWKPDLGDDGEGGRGVGRSGSGGGGRRDKSTEVLLQRLAALEERVRTGSPPPGARMHSRGP